MQELDVVRRIPKELLKPLAAVSVLKMELIDLEGAGQDRNALGFQELGCDTD